MTFSVDRIHPDSGIVCSSRSTTDDANDVIRRLAKQAIDDSDYEHARKWIAVLEVIDGYGLNE